jgi:hypothetical protein
MYVFDTETQYYGKLVSSLLSVDDLDVIFNLPRW